jgi:hypothetical protein
MPKYGCAWGMSHGISCVTVYVSVRIDAGGLRRNAVSEPTAALRILPHPMRPKVRESSRICVGAITGHGSSQFWTLSWQGRALFTDVEGRKVAGLKRSSPQMASKRTRASRLRLQGSAPGCECRRWYCAARRSAKPFHRHIRWARRVMVKLSAAFRPQAAALDLEWLDRMSSHFSREAPTGGLGAGRLCLKICEHKVNFLAMVQGASKLRRGIFLARSGMAKHDGGYT